MKRAKANATRAVKQRANGHDFIVNDHAAQCISPKINRLAEKTKSGWAVYASTKKGERSNVTPHFRTKRELARYCAYKPVLESNNAYINIYGIASYGEWLRIITQKVRQQRRNRSMLN